MDVQLSSIELGVFEEGHYTLREALRLRDELQELLSRDGLITIPDDSPTHGEILTTVGWFIGAMDSEWSDKAKAWVSCEPKYYASYQFPIRD